MIIWGYRTYVKMLGIITLVCGHCGRPAAQRAEQLNRKFTLFFIPLFTYRTTTTLTCTFCGTRSAVPKEHVPQLIADLEGPQTPPSPDQPPAPAPPSAVQPGAGPWPDAPLPPHRSS